MSQDRQELKPRDHDAPERGSLEKPAPASSHPAPAAFSPEDMARRNRRSIALALVLGGLVLFFFIVTLAKTGPAILNRPL